MHSFHWVWSGEEKRPLVRGVDISLGMDSRDVAACETPCICSKVWVVPWTRHIYNEDCEVYTLDLHTFTSQQCQHCDSTLPFHT